MRFAKNGWTKVKETAIKEDRKTTAREIMYAFIEPTLTFKESDPGAEDFIALVGRSFSDPDDTVRNVFFRYMKPMLLLLFEALSEALPSIPHNTFSFGVFNFRWVLWLIPCTDAATSC